MFRLFPFKRGLTHAYWAPNFWSLYNFMDLVCAKLLKILLDVNAAAAGCTSGLVGDYSHVILPNISPKICLCMSLIFIIPFGILVMVKGKNFQSFCKYLVLCSFISFMFGWHVHEKAILMVIIPLKYLSMDFKYTKLFIITSLVGYFSLMPLLFTQFESLLKYLLLIFYSIWVFHSFDYCMVWPKSKSIFRLPLLNIGESIYIFGLIAVELYASFFHDYIFGLGLRFPFIPLMLISIYCSIGLVYCFVLLCWRILSDETGIDVKIHKYFWRK